MNFSRFGNQPFWRRRGCGFEHAGADEMHRVAPIRDGMRTLERAHPRPPAAAAPAGRKNSRKFRGVGVEFAVALVNVDDDSLGVEPVRVLAKVNGVGGFSERKALAVGDVRLFSDVDEISADRAPPVGAMRCVGCSPPRRSLPPRRTGSVSCRRSCLTATTSCVRSKLAQTIARQAPLGVQATLANARAAVRDGDAAAEAGPDTHHPTPVHHRGRRAWSASIPHPHPGRIRRTLSGLASTAEDTTNVAPDTGIDHVDKGKLRTGPALAVANLCAPCEHRC